MCCWLEVQGVHAKNYNPMGIRGTIRDDNHGNHYNQRRCAHKAHIHEQHSATYVNARQLTTPTTDASTTDTRSTFVLASYLHRSGQLFRRFRVILGGKLLVTQIVPKSNLQKWP